MADLSALEHSTLKVPYELLNKKFRTAQKTLDREASHVQHCCSVLDKLLHADTEGAVKVADVAAVIRHLIDKLRIMNSRVDAVVIDEFNAATLLKRRVEHLTAGGQQGHGEQWRRLRVERLVVDFLLRAGLYDSAKLLAQQCDIDFLTNRDIFMTAKLVEESLNRHQLDRCLEWTHDNKSKLRRLKSRLELVVRTQEFVELVRSERRREAVDYARKWFSGVECAAWQGELQRAMGLLAVGASTDIAEYRSLLAEDRWTELIKLFRTENIRLYQLTDQSVFSACFQCGLSALKTPHCVAGGVVDGETSRRMDGEGGVTRKDCPVCLADVHALADGLPFAHAAQSRLVCAYSGQPLNEHNAPMMLPNGMVYGQNSLSALEHDGCIVCPRTNTTFSIDQVVRVYVM